MEKLKDNMFGKKKFEFVPSQNSLCNLTWDQVMELSPVLEGASDNAKQEFLKSIANHAGHSLAIALQSANFIINGGKMLVEFEQKSQALRFMTSLGRELAVQVTKHGNKTAEIGKLATKGAALTSAATATVGAVVIVAHMISAADNAQKLKEANLKLDFLIAARRIDQCAKLEAIFRHAKELLSLPGTLENQRELHRLGLGLHELRATWRGEVRRRMDLIDVKSPEDTKNWLMKPIRYIRRGTNTNKATELVYQNLIEVHLLNVSLGMHVALAQASGTLDGFLKHSLAEEIEEIRKLSTAISDLRSQIEPKYKLATSRISETEKAFSQTMEIFEPIAKIYSQDSLEATVTLIEKKTN